MADEPMTQNGTTTFDPNVQWGRLSERVENQGKDIVDLRSNMNTGFQGVNSNLAALSNELRNSAKTNWSPIWAALSVGVAILTGLGFMALQPIKESNADQKQAIVALTAATNQSLQAIIDKMVTREEMDWRSTRGAEDRVRTEKDLDYLRANSVPRTVWEERNHARDTEISDLGRRIDEIRQEVGAVYGTRDVIIDLKKEIDNLRQRLNARGFQPGG